ncbi:tape measure protein [Enterococcus asini]|uniref:tape measure protein n=1 Tax=Enterococcus asini TaxID=57732 RepID=UPI00241C7F47|nr:tape measure protein [Enterococcus asini]
MALGKISFQIDVDTKQLSSNLKQATSSFKAVADTAEAAGGKVGKSVSPLKGMSSAVGGFISKVGQFAVAGVAVKAASAAFQMLSDNVQEALSASDSLDKFQQTMQFAGIDKGAISEASKAVKKYADDTVYDLSTVANTTAQLASNGVKDFTGLTQAAGNLNAVAGGNADTFKSVAMVLTQTAGAGKLTTENWNQLSDAIPGAAGPLQKALQDAGAYTGNFRDAMAEGQITADEFNSALMDLGMSDVAKEAATSTSTFEGAFGSLEATVVNGLQSMIDSIGKGNLVGLINGFTSAVQTGFQWVGQAIQTVMPYVSAFVSGFISGVSSLMPTIVTAFQGIMDVAVPILTTVFSFIMEAVANVVAFWNANGQTIMAGVSVVFNTISSIISTIMPVITTVVGAAWELIKSVITTTLNIIMNAVKLFSAILSGDWSAAWEAVKEIGSAVWSYLKTAFQSALTTMLAVGSGVLNSIKAVFSTVWNAIKAVTTAVWNGIKSAISSAINGAKSTATGAVNAIKSTVSSVFNGLKSTVTSVWNGIKSAITNPIEAAKNIVSGIVNKIKGLFNFKLKFPPIEIPKIPLPYFKISGSFNPLKGQIPKLDIGWHATGGIFTGPSVIGVGEAGDEAVVPLSNKSRMAPFAKAVADFMQDGQKQESTSRRTAQPVSVESHIYLNEREIVRAITPGVTKRQTVDKVNDNRRNGLRK